MAITKLADIYDPKIIGSAVDERFLLKSAIIRGGAVTLDGTIAANIAKGTAFEVPIRLDTSTHTANVSSDDDGATAPTQKLVYGFQRVAPLNRNGRWGQADLARIVVGEDPLGVLANRIGDFWAKEVQASFLSCLTGIMADNITNDSGDMQLDLYQATVASVTSANRASRDAFIEVKGTAGDRRQEFAVCFMHSSVAKYLEKTDITNFEKPSEAMPFKAYNGMVVIEDDSLPIFGDGTALAAYGSYVYCVTADFCGYDFSTQGLIAEEMHRSPELGNGGGVEYLYSRRRYAFAPNGLSLGNVTNPTEANLQAAANWNRVASGRKNVGLARLKINI